MTVTKLRHWLARRLARWTVKIDPCPGTTVTLSHPAPGGFIGWKYDR